MVLMANRSLKDPARKKRTYPVLAAHAFADN
jgi:hypothetical protein